VVAFTQGDIEPACAAEIIVSAAASLTDALAEIGTIYQTSRKNVVRFNLGASSELARQIEVGAAADIFFSADGEKMDDLETKGLIDSATRRNLLSNRLALVVAAGGKAPLSAPKDLLRPEIRRLALAQPDTVPAGIYAKKYLQAEGLWEGVSGKVIPVANVRAALASVEAGNVDAAFVYKTDATISPRVKVVYEVPADKAPEIIYPVAATKESKNGAAAREFLIFLSGPQGKAAFRKYGFIVIE